MEYTSCLQLGLYLCGLSSTSASFPRVYTSKGYSRPCAFLPVQYRRCGGSEFCGWTPLPFSISPSQIDSWWSRISRDFWQRILQKPWWSQSVLKCEDHCVKSSLLVCLHEKSWVSKVLSICAHCSWATRYIQPPSTYAWTQFLCGQDWSTTNELKQQLLGKSTHTLQLQLLAMFPHPQHLARLTLTRLIKIQLWMLG